MMSMFRLCLAASLHRSVAEFVLDVGAPRTGTQSMWTALKSLGLNTLWSGFYSSFRVPFCQYLMEKDVPFPAELLQGFEGAMDEPFHLLYEEVLRAYPDAKFVYTLADPDTWYESYINFYDHLPHGYFGTGDRHPPPGVHVKEPMNRMVALQKAKAGQDPPQNPNDVDKMAPGFKAEFWECNSVHAWGCRFENLDDRNDPEIRQRCLRGFQQHREKVFRTIPKERLLVFNLSDGWTPLCDFLGRPVPDEAFPRVDRFELLPTMAPITGVSLVQRHAERVRRKEEL